MAHKKLGGWVIKNKLFAQIKIANELWSFSRKDGSNQKQVHLFFVGWYEKDGAAKLFTITCLWLSIQVGF